MNEPSNPYVGRISPNALSYIVMGVESLSFIGIQNDEMRMPIEGVVLNGSRIEWLRADGASECIDLHSARLEQVFAQQFKSQEGLMIALFDELLERNCKASSYRFVALTIDGMAEIAGSSEASHSHQSQ